MRNTPPGTDFARLVRRCQQGDRRAWDLLVTELEPIVYGVVRRLGLSREDAQDAFQDAFVKLFASLDRIASPAALPKWMAVTTARECLRLKRIASDATTDVPLDQLIAAEERAADAIAFEADQAFAVRAALRELGGRCADLLDLLHRDEPASYTEISEQLQMPVGAIGPTRARCLGKLRSLLDSRGFFG